MTIDFKYTELFRSTLIDSKLDKTTAKSIIKAFENKLNTFPESCTISGELLKVGISTYREYVSEKGYRVFYSYDNELNLVTAHAIVHQQRDIQNALFEILIQR
ncbi:type II toxin-antitoxin system RelE/ParE family toxin [Providencia huashanensis]|uniref:type II toxin-antitoxin system RelE/ParE family toxin n=1 Tax=Providencia huashanensis TaxID=3037798 RepID=UPI00404664DC